ncbi:MAG: trigger factor [Elusimicrobia bacterium]|nr:trigger factor [Elusimicrobiota bacterium]
MDGLTYNIKKEPKCVVGLDIEVGWETVDRELDKVFRDMTRDIRVPGFRKGKVPINVIKERYGPHAEQEVISRFSPEVINEVLEKEKLVPVTTPVIEDYNFKKGEPFKLNVKVEVSPEVQPKKYKKMKLVKKAYEITGEDVEKTIRSLKENNASLKVKEGVVSKDDFALVDIKIFRDSREIDLGLSKDRLIEVGSESMLPGFGDHLVGMKKGDEKTFQYTFPENYHKDELKGMEAEFRVLLKEVKEKELPEEKEIAKSLGLESEEKLREKVRENLEKQLDASSDSELENTIVENILEKHEFDIPEGLVKRAFESNKKQMESYVAGRGGDASRIDDAKIMEKTRRDIKAGIILSEIAKAEDIKVTEVDRREEEEKLKKLMGTDSGELVKKYVDENSILTRKVFDFIKDNAKIKTEKIRKRS